MKRLMNSVLAQTKITIISSFQYRVQEGLQLLGLLVESVIYLVVWTTIAQARGGTVGGYTAGEFAAYFIAWSFVRNATTGWSPWGMEWRIRRGEFNALLLRPVHPYWTDMGDMLGGKAIQTITLIPTMALLVLAFRPEFAVVPWSLLALAPALLLAFLLRYTLMYGLAVTAFWTTRVTALFEVWYALEFFTSGRVAPLSVLPEWAQGIAGGLPFQWMFYFPLELFLGRLTQAQALQGFLMQGLWLLAVIVLMKLIWRAAIRQYGAVGG
jgi:ABC-2 type transport system permease protein